MLLGFPFEFYLFGMTILGIAISSWKELSRDFEIALLGLILLISYKFSVNFNFGHHIGNEWKSLINLLLIIPGFTLMAKYFELSGLPNLILRFLPLNKSGPFILLVVIGFLSIFLDNIAAALIGATIAKKIFQNKVHTGFIAAIVACSNAGGAFSVIGDTTTTMIWFHGVGQPHLIRAFIGSTTSILICSYFASKQQFNFYPIQKNIDDNAKLDCIKIFSIPFIIAGAIFTNIFHDWQFPGLGVLLTLIIFIPLVGFKYEYIKHSIKKTLFLISLVSAASLLPLDEIQKFPPSQSWTFVIGVLSAIFDNIPLTKLAIDINGFDFAYLAFAVGFGGSIMWFGSSAGVAILGEFSNAEEIKRGWLKNSWFIPLAYVLGFIAMCLVFNWTSFTLK
ncbi:MAG: SLC13 family permease [Bacteroidia bacterium]